MVGSWINISNFLLVLGLSSHCLYGSPVEEQIDVAMASNSSEPAKNLTSISWAHAVNSQKELEDALQGDVDMIEADIVLGKLNNTGPDVPVMGHPPANSSDITLNTFLRTILQHNRNHANHTKGVKLDFKSIEVFEGSLGILSDLWDSMNYPIWLNADILKGPVNQTTTVPVDPARFFAGCKKFDNAVLSVGWTTRWGENFTEGAYTDNEINDMIQTIKTNNVTKTNQKITYPVRAGIAAHSQTQLHNLVKAINATNECTLTIWSSKNDAVDIEKLRQLIFSFGFDRVYLDVPDEVSSKLNLSHGPGNSAVSPLVDFGIISLLMLLASLALQRSEL